MLITATELKENLDQYLLMTRQEDIYITENGNLVAKLTAPCQERVNIAESLFGSLPDSFTLEQAKESRQEA